MYFKHSASKLVVIGLVAGVCAPVGAQSVMQPGGWQMQIKVTAQNPTTGESKNMSESTSKMCLSKEFLANDPYLNPSIDKGKMEQKKAKCTISDEQRKGNTASWKMTCLTADGSTVVMSIKNTASLQKLVSDIQQVVKKEGETVLVKIVMNSSFIGECTNDMPRL